MSVWQPPSLARWMALKPPVATGGRTPCGTPALGCVILSAAKNLIFYCELPTDYRTTELAIRINDQQRIE